ncbi:hypothetical protein [Cellulomonas citrea]|uniref:hypothetical protein n=1 Tax=Cellulomonas citrea TaxID=1909423 RepID=UPI00135851AB|nr:hypothetical protein [Cellulomonas citrea]
MWQINESTFGPMLVVDGEPPAAPGALIRSCELLNVFRQPESASGRALVEGLCRSFATVIVTDVTWRGVEFIEESSALRELDFWPQPERAPDVPPTSGLRAFAGYRFPEWRSLRLHPGIEGLHLEGGDFSWVEGTPWHLTRLSLTQARKVQAIPDVPQLRGLQELQIHGSPRLDARSLGQMRDLRSVEFATVRSLVLPEEWPSRMRMDTLVLEQVREVENASALLEAPIDQIRIIARGRPPFDDDLLAAARRSTRPRWVGKGFDV